MNRDQKLLSQLGFSDEQTLTVKSSGTGTPSGSSESSASASSSSSSAVFNSAYALEQVPPQSRPCTNWPMNSHSHDYMDSDAVVAVPMLFLSPGEVPAWCGDGFGV